MSQITQLSHSQAPDSQKVYEIRNACFFKLLSCEVNCSFVTGFPGGPDAICYTAIYITNIQKKYQNFKKMRVKEESEKAGLKFSIQKKKIMASGPITSRQTDGEKEETVTDFIFLGSKIIADGDCSYEFKIHLLLVRKTMTDLDSVFKSRDITLPAKVHIVKAMVSPLVM